MTTNHIDQLTEWWETAEEGVVQKGDTVIERWADGQYNVFTAFESETQENDRLRILARAPKPKPAWHDAAAVVATVETMSGPRRAVFSRDQYLSDVWNSTTSITANIEDLRDVTPLIEAKVTHQMVNRILDRIDDHFDAHPARIGEEIAVAALGLETR